MLRCSENSRCVAKMHELSIAQNLVETVEAAARQANARAVQVVYLRMGVLSGVVKEALLFSYDVAVTGTLLEGSRLEIETVLLTVYCPTCAATVELPTIQLFRCPRCGTPTGDIRSGRELEIVSVEVPDDETAPA